jgi:hypothetical protein
MDQNITALDAIAEMIRIGDGYAPEAFMPTDARVVLLLRKCGIGPERLRAWLIAHNPAPSPGPPDGWWTEEVIAKANADADELEAQLATLSRITHP